MNSVTQDMKFRQSLLEFCLKYGVGKASRKYNKGRSYIYFWLKRYDGKIESLACQSRRPHHHPAQHTADEIKLIKNLRRRNPKLGMTEIWLRARERGYRRCPESMFRLMRREGMMPVKEKPQPKKSKPYEQMQYPGQRVQIDVKFVPRNCVTEPGLKLYQFTAIDEYSRNRFLGAYDEHSSYSAADFLKKVVQYFEKKNIRIECVQTDNGTEFTKRFVTHKDGTPTLFEATAADLGIRHKLIRPYTPRHNGKVERSHREDQKLFYSCHSFYSLADFDAQLAVHQNRTNNKPMRPLGWLTPSQMLQRFFR